MSDPYYGGIDEVEHVWVRPLNPPCPDCECCTAALCEKAEKAFGSCGHFGSAADFDLFKCPCNSRRGAA